MRWVRSRGIGKEPQGRVRVHVSKVMTPGGVGEEDA